MNSGSENSFDSSVFMIVLAIVLIVIPIFYINYLLFKEKYHSKAKKQPKTYSSGASCGGNSREEYRSNNGNLIDLPNALDIFFLLNSNNQSDDRKDNYEQRSYSPNEPEQYPNIDQDSTNYDSDNANSNFLE